jgi:predicted exporter
MSILSKLKLSTRSPRQQLSPVDRKRGKLLEKLDQQIAATEAALKDEAFVEQVRQWVRVEGSEDKQLVTKTRPVKKWWWTNENGQVMFSLRLGNRILEVEPGKPAVEVGKLEGLPEVLATLREAIVAGELDKQLENAAIRVNPIPRSKAASK